MPFVDGYYCSFFIPILSRNDPLIPDGLLWETCIFTVGSGHRTGFMVKSGMMSKRMKPFWLAGILFGLVFGILFSIRINLFNKIFFQTTWEDTQAPVALVERDTWMNILQKDRKIGFSHSIISNRQNGYRLEETFFMRVNLMGLVQEVNFETRAELNTDLSIASFRFDMNSGRFRFNASGTVSGQKLSIKVKGEGESRQYDIQLQGRPYLSAGIFDAIIAYGLAPGDTRTFSIFDMATMGQAPVVVRVLGKESIMNMGTRKDVTKVSVSFKGVDQAAWISESGEVLKEEGFLGMRLEKVSRHEALYGLPVTSSQDLTKAASVASNVNIDKPLDLLQLRVRIQGISLEGLKMDGGRQSLVGNVLTITKENMLTIPSGSVNDLASAPGAGAFLEPSPFIQSDHKIIKNKARQIVSDIDSPLEKVKKLADWVYENVEKRPVISVPDAISVLKNRVGDCNEHAILLAALLRAASIPTKIETGLVYLNGRFYYHAWNLVYIGSWVTVDALFGQMPADVTHIRVTTGTEQDQLDLLGLIGKIRLEVLDNGNGD